MTVPLMLKLWHTNRHSKEKHLSLSPPRLALVSPFLSHARSLFASLPLYRTSGPFMWRQELLSFHLWYTRAAAADMRHGVYLQVHLCSSQCCRPKILGSRHHELLGRSGFSEQRKPSSRLSSISRSHAEIWHPKWGLVWERTGMPQRM
jgi:hypothetical protein